MTDTATSLPQATPLVPVVAFPYTGDYRIDTLLQDPSYRWNKDAPFGTPVTVTYSFMSVKPFYGGTDEGDGDRGFSPFTAQQQAAARQVFARLQTELGIAFVEVADSASSYGQIRMGNNTQRLSSGYAYLPYSTSSDKNGDIWLDRGTPSNLTDLVPGSLGWSTLVHEIGHALGLNHPGDYNAGDRATNAPGNYLGVLEDNTNYTIMSYNDAAGGQQRDWFGMYDLLTLRTLYGSGAPRSGNTVYSLDDSAGTLLGIVNDAGGIDTLDVSAATLGAAIDLVPGRFSSVGRNGAAAANNNLSIDLSTVIENVVGTRLDDSVRGNDASNYFMLGAGRNAAEGGAGVDTAAYALPAASYQITQSAGTLRVIGAGVSDTLVQIERLVFADYKLAFDTAGNAGTTAKILGAVFGPQAVANREYAAIGLQLLDAGSSYAAVMQLALDAKLGVGASAQAVVTLLYSNVVGSAPGAAELALYTGLLQSGQYNPATLGMLAADAPANAAGINLVGLAATGLAYA
ncbi:MAG: M10 family metallopeptidase C-terminal domain-containing protein [Ramlibacter sp.]